MSSADIWGRVREEGADLDNLIRISTTRRGRTGVRRPRPRGLNGGWLPINATCRVFLVLLPEKGPLAVRPSGFGSVRVLGQETRADEDVPVAQSPHLENGRMEGTTFARAYITH